MSFLDQVCKKQYTLTWRSLYNDPQNLDYKYGERSSTFKYNSEQQTTGCLYFTLIAPYDVISKIWVSEMDENNYSSLTHTSLSFILSQDHKLYNEMKKCGIFDNYSPLTQMSFLKEVVKKENTFQLFWSTDNDPHKLTYKYGAKNEWFNYNPHQQTTGTLCCTLKNIPLIPAVKTAVKTELAKYNVESGFGGILKFYVPDNSELYEQMSKAGIFNDYELSFINPDDIST